MKRFIVFIHIERAGGTSLHHLLHYNFKNYKTINPYYLYTNKEEAFFRLENLKKLLQRYPKLDGIGGHTTRSFLNYESAVNNPIFYITFLREPISRYMSHFNYQRQVMNINWSIEDFIEDEYFNNFQTKRIIGEANFKKAYNELLKYSFVGLSEEYNQSLLMLSKKIDWYNFNPLYEKKNEIPSKSKSIKFSELDKEVQEKIISNNSIDIELYNAVKSEIYYKQKKDYKGNLEKDLIEFEQQLLQYRYRFFKKYFNKINKAIFHYFFEKKIVMLK